MINLSLTGYIVTGIVIYAICIVIAICLIIFVHKKYQDPTFLQGIVLSTFFHILVLLPNLIFLFFPIVYVFGLIFGILAGYVNTNIKRGSLSGALCVLISWICYGALTYNSIVLLFSVEASLIYLLPSILCGAIGGVIGYKIRYLKERQLDSNKSEPVKKDNNSQGTV